MTTGFKFTHSGGTVSDFDDMFIRKSQFVDWNLWAWGRNILYGELGDGTTVSKSSPIQTIAGGSEWKQVECGTYNTSAIKTDGTLWVWGTNAFGILGDGTTVSKSSPVQTITGGTDWSVLSYGSFYTNNAIKTDGTLWLWGYNNSGQLGDGTTVSKSSPIQTVTGGTDWKQSAAGYMHTAAIKNDGTLWLWGRGDNGQLGDGTSVSKSSPIQTIAGGTDWKQVSCGIHQTAAIKNDGTLWMWGDNQYGQLGDGTVVSKSSPIQTIAGGTDWKQVACGDRHTAAIKTDGTLWMWGRGDSGQLGDNTIVHKSSPIQTIAGGTTWKVVVPSSGNISAAIKIDGTLWTWGWNANGALGDGTTVSKSSPIQTIAGGSDWKYNSAGADHMAAIRYTY